MASIAARLVLAVVTLPAVAAPGGLWWWMVGTILALSVLPALRTLADVAIDRPALALVGRPKVNGTRLEAFRLYPDAVSDPPCAEALVAAIRRALGEPAVDGSNLGWVLDGSPAAYPEPSREGLWVHIDGAGAATVLASAGRAAAALVAAVAPAGAIGPASPGTTPGGEDGR